MKSTFGYNHSQCQPTVMAATTVIAGMAASGLSTSQKFMIFYPA